MRVAEPVQQRRLREIVEGRSVNTAATADVWLFESSRRRFCAVLTA